MASRYKFGICTRYCPDNFRSSQFSKAGISDLILMRQVKSHGAMIHVRMSHSGIMHADNLRSIKYYHSGKVIMKFRVGNYKLSSVDEKWSFFLIRGVK